jgi:hypothetical protein
VSVLAACSPANPAPITTTRECVGGTAVAISTGRADVSRTIDSHGAGNPSRVRIQCATSATTRRRYPCPPRVHPSRPCVCNRSAWRDCGRQRHSWHHSECDRRLANMHPN